MSAIQIPRYTAADGKAIVQADRIEGTRDGELWLGKRLARPRPRRIDGVRARPEWVITGCATQTAKRR